MKKKLAWVIITLFCIVAFVTLYFLFGGNESIVTSFQFSEHIHVQDGEADVTVREIPFMLEKSGTYTMYAQWDPHKYALDEAERMADAGMITGIAVYNPAGEIVFCVTGESVDAESMEVKLQAGEYVVQYRYLTNDEALDALVLEADATRYDTGTYTYAENAAFSIITFAADFEVPELFVKNNEVFLTGTAFDMEILQCNPTSPFWYAIIASSLSLKIIPSPFAPSFSIVK